MKIKNREFGLWKEAVWLKSESIFQNAHTDKSFWCEKWSLQKLNCTDYFHEKLEAALHADYMTFIMMRFKKTNFLCYYSMNNYLTVQCIWYKYQELFNWIIVFLLNVHRQRCLLSISRLVSLLLQASFGCLQNEVQQCVLANKAFVTYLGTEILVSQIPCTKKEKKNNLS